MSETPPESVPAHAMNIPDMQIETVKRILNTRYTADEIPCDCCRVIMLALCRKPNFSWTDVESVSTFLGLGHFYQCGKHPYHIKVTLGDRMMGILNETNHNHMRCQHCRTQFLHYQALYARRTFVDIPVVTFVQLLTWTRYAHFLSCPEFEFCAQPIPFKNAVDAEALPACRRCHAIFEQHQAEPHDLQLTPNDLREFDNTGHMPSCPNWCAVALDVHKKATPND